MPTNPSLSRRALLLRAAQAGVAVAVAGNTDLLRTAVAGAAEGGAKGPGRLLDDPAGLLDLPPGFHYEIVSRADDGSGAVVRPGRFDGTGAFDAGNGRVALVRNHEQSTSGPSTVAFAEGAPIYDPAVRGGTSTVVVDRFGRRVSERVSLAGTYNNCAGGVTPWGTWLTCEESDLAADPGRPGYRPGVATKNHGYVFEVHPALGGDATPILQLGRFAHEAAAVDPRTGAVYLTEDASGPFGLVYRYAPTTKPSTFGGLRSTHGPFAAMRCSLGGAHVPTLHPFTEPGTTLAVDWTDIPDRDATTTVLRKQRGDDEVTRSQKFEGAWYADGKVFIVCSFSREAGREHDGQVWSLDPVAGTLTLEVRFARNLQAGAGEPGADAPDGPDNITVASSGGLFLAEDGEGVQHLLAVAPDGSTEVFARNRHPESSEFTGVVFSPDGTTLFANIQEPGITIAITGPFERLPRR